MLFETVDAFDCKHLQSVCKSKKCPCPVLWTRVCVVHGFGELRLSGLVDMLGRGIVREITVMLLSRFGGDLLSHVLRRSTIGAAALNGRVRDGIGCFARAMTTKPRQQHQTKS